MKAKSPLSARRGGSITLPKGATPEEIDNALRPPAAEQEHQ